jgi:hypothetical protein
MLDRVLGMTSNSKVCLTLDAQIIENYLKFCLENSDTVCWTIYLSSSCAYVFFLRSCLSNLHAEFSRMASDWAKEHATKEDLFDPQNAIRVGIELVAEWAVAPAYRKKCISSHIC